MRTGRRSRKAVGQGSPEAGIRATGKERFGGQGQACQGFSNRNFWNAPSIGGSTTDRGIEIVHMIDGTGSLQDLQDILSWTASPPLKRNGRGCGEFSSGAILAP